MYFHKNVQDDELYEIESANYLNCLFSYYNQIITVLNMIDNNDPNNIYKDLIFSLLSLYSRIYNFIYKNFPGQEQYYINQEYLNKLPENQLTLETNNSFGDNSFGKNPLLETKNFNPSSINSSQNPLNRISSQNSLNRISLGKNDDVKKLSLGKNDNVNKKFLFSGMIGGKRKKTMKKCIKKPRKTNKPNKTNKKNVKKSRKTKRNIRR